MEYNSFYGGRQGASFVIQERFPSIDEMKNQFKLGNGYKTVNYDEYVIIDTENKNNPDNGKVYRRGYDYNNNMGGALYVGQIVGPAGLAPHTELKTIAEVNAIEETEEFEYRRGEGEYTVTNASLVPGKESDGTFNDTIEWAYCSVRDENSHESTAHVGFKFPYTIIDFTATAVSPYTQETEELAIRIDDQAHPFYEKWQLQVPKGIKGDALRNLKIVERSGKTYLVYENVNYDNSADGVVTNHDVGEINYINKVTFNQDTGVIAIDYSAASDTSFQLNYPSSIRINDNYKLEVTYIANPNNPVEIGEPIKYIEKTEIKTSNYHLMITYNTGEVVDLGSVKSDSGILIGENFINSSIVTVQGWIDYLNITYPEGRKDPDTNKPDGRIVTAGSDYENKGFYAFNYQYDTNGKYKGWYYLGTIGSATLSAIALPAEEDGSIPDLASQLPLNGIWFVTEE